MTLAQRGVRSCTLRGNSCVQSTQCSGGAPRLRLLFLLACRRQGTVHTGARAFTAGTFHKLQGHFTNEATACGTLVIQGDTLPLRHGHSCFKGTFALRGVARWHSAPRYSTHSRRGPWGGRYLETALQPLAPRSCTSAGTPRSRELAEFQHSDRKSTLRP